MEKRSHRMLALVLDPKKYVCAEEQLVENFSDANVDNLGHKSSSPEKQQQQPVTNLKKIWTRSLDYGQFPAIFDFHKEYLNSQANISNYDTTIMESSIDQFHTDIKQLKTLNKRQNDLSCYETFPASLFQEEYEPELINDQLNGCQASTSVVDVLLNDFHPDTSSYAEDSDDSIKDKDYFPSSVSTSPSSVQSVLKNINENLLVQEHLLNYTQHNLNHIESENATARAQINEESDFSHNFCILNDQTGSFENIQFIQPDENPTVNHNQSQNGPGKGLTKKGNPRKRRLMHDSLKDRQKLKEREEIKRMRIKTPCSGGCRKHCTNNFTEERRLIINDNYIKLNWEARGIFIKTSVEKFNVKVRKSTSKGKRNISYAYFFENDNGKKQEVCKTFFLTTLGYDKNNDRRVLSALKKPITNQKCGRGKHPKTEKLDRSLLRNHIESFHPAVSHYRREHAPKKLYLPSDINVNMMFNDFKENHSEVQLSYELYRRFVKKEMNISFAHLGNEECDQCTIFKEHEKDHTPNEKEKCKICIKQERHKMRYTESREEYDGDRRMQSETVNNIYYSADLQKVIMLPRLNMFKAAIFCPRLIAFNESFVPLGPTTKKHLPYAVLWNESIAGRSQEDIISTFRSFLISKRDSDQIVLWVDNCSAQNKNWAFISFLVEIVNSDKITANTIIIKYFEPGHTFMSADHFHHQVEKGLKQKNKVYDFEDFVETVKSSNSRKNITKVMSTSDFYFYKDRSSKQKIRNSNPRIYLKDIMSVKCERGKLYMMYKKSHKEDYKDLYFFPLKILSSGVFPEALPRSEPRGISMQRKQAIITKICPLMPASRKIFWENLPIDNAAVDLITSHDEEENTAP